MRQLAPKTVCLSVAIGQHKIADNRLKTWHKMQTTESTIGPGHQNRKPFYKSIVAETFSTAQKRFSGQNSFREFKTDARLARWICFSIAACRMSFE